jgi:hypothetical protein
VIVQVRVSPLWVIVIVAELFPVKVITSRRVEVTGVEPV